MEESHGKPFIEHISELRVRVIIVIVYFVATLFATYLTTPYLLNIIKYSAAKYQISLNIFKITESVLIYMKTMIIQSICLSFPVLFYQLYRFVAPAIDKKTKHNALKVAPVISLLFAIGVILGFLFLVPLLILFLISVAAELRINTIYSFADYFDFIFMICLITGSMMELPMLLGFLTYIQVISSDTLVKYRRFVYPFLCFIGIIVTPPDFLSDFIVSILLIILFEIGTLLCKFIELKRKKNVQITSVKGGD
jgi:sec-independent protein translocase protein TatC